MGAQISGIASNLLTIVGVKKLHGAGDTLPDTSSGFLIGSGCHVWRGHPHQGCVSQEPGIIPDAFRRFGREGEGECDDVIPEQKHYVVDSFIDGTIMTLADAPWPGLTPDLPSVLLVVATQARGSVLFHQNIAPRAACSFR